MNSAIAITLAIVTGYFISVAMEINNDNEKTPKKADIGKIYHVQKRP